MSPRKQNPKAAEVHTSAKRRGNPKALALAHFADVLADPKATQARKDKAARLLLTHTGAAVKTRRLPPSAAVGEKGKKELQREDAQSAGKGESKWAGLLQ